MPWVYQGELVTPVGRRVGGHLIGIPFRGTRLTPPIEVESLPFGVGDGEDRTALSENDVRPKWQRAAGAPNDRGEVGASVLRLDLNTGNAVECASQDVGDGGFKEQV